MAALFDANSWVWITDEKEMYLPVKIVKPFRAGEEGRVKYEDGKEVTISAKVSKEAVMMDEAALQTYDNMIKLNDRERDAPARPHSQRAPVRAFAQARERTRRRCAAARRTRPARAAAVRLRACFHAPLATLAGSAR